jgi:hypothetical protein
VFKNKLNPPPPPQRRLFRNQRFWINRSSIEVVPRSTLPIPAVYALIFSPLPPKHFHIYTHVKSAETHLSFIRCPSRCITATASRIYHWFPNCAIRGIRDQFPGDPWINSVVATVKFTNFFFKWKEWGFVKNSRGFSLIGDVFISYDR